MSEHETPHNIDELKHELEEHDEWFRHSSNEVHQAAHGDFNPYVVLSFLGITVAIVFAVAFVVVPWFARLVQAQKAAVQESSPRITQEYMEAKTAWEADLTGEPTWIDEKQGVVRVPIDFAIDQVVRRYRDEER